MTCASRFWHASFSALPIGTILVPRPDYEMRWDDPCAARILETLRPAEMLAHRDAVFMCDNPQDCDNAGAHTEWLFEVEPSAAPERHDMEWATQIDQLLTNGWPSDDPTILDLAQRYWAGKPSDNPTWEYLAPSARILSIEAY